MLRFPFASNQDLSVTFSVIRKFNKKSSKAFLLPTPYNLPNYQLQSTIPVTILVHVIRDDFEIITKLIKTDVYTKFSSVKTTERKFKHN